ncbi:MAG TPA: hypothetical protein VLW47_01995 [Thermodesulfobacteriota bacterium]|nr:hypothetical protein [Thermodesulfobacteriota bacterium]
MKRFRELVCGLGEELEWFRSTGCYSGMISLSFNLMPGASRSPARWMRYVMSSKRENLGWTEEFSQDRHNGKWLANATTERMARTIRSTSSSNVRSEK